MNNIEKVKALLGEPVVNVEMTIDQIQECINMASKHRDDLVMQFGCDKLSTFIFDKLTLIYCKRVWRTSMTKYSGGNSHIAINTEFLETLDREETSLYDLIGNIKN